MSSPTWARSTVVIADRARRPDRDHRLPAGEPTSARRAHRPRRVVIAVKAFGLSADTVLPFRRVTAAPRVRLPTVSWSQLRRLPAPVLTVAFLCIAQTAASVRSARSATADVVGFNRDLVAIGAGSLGAGMIGSFAVDASPRIQPSGIRRLPIPTHQHLRSTRCTRCGAGVLRSVGGHP